MITLAETARTIFQRALADCSIELATARYLSVRDAQLRIGGEEAIDLGGLRHIRIVAAGKAAQTMLAALLQTLPPLPYCQISGVVIAPRMPTPLPGGFQYFCGGHPEPNEASFAGARAALATVRAARADTDGALCLFLISGGASAMMELPLDPAITLAETAAFHRALVASGAPITEMNCVRKHFSAVKGGRLASTAGSALCRTLLVSDVPPASSLHPNPEEALGSGPTVPDASTVQQCREILTRQRLLSQFPAAVRRFFESPTLPETPKPEELVARTCTLLDSDDLARSALRHAQALGWRAVIDNTCDEWEYRDAARSLLARLRALRKQSARVCLISTGEVLVALPPGPVGIGGRNQQFTVFAATLLTPPDRTVAILSAGSDGIDGNSPAAGAVIDSTEKVNADFPIQALDALANFNTHPFLQQWNATLTTGPTGNNLRDLRLLLAENSSSPIF